MRSVLFSEETHCGSILLSDPFPQAASEPSHFGWSLTGVLTLLKSSILILEVISKTSVCASA